MIGAIKDRVDRYLGRGRHSIAIPVMDGPLHPNQKLDDAAEIFSATQIDNLAVVGADIFFSSGPTLMRVPHGAGTPETVADLDASITFMAAAADGTLAIGLDGNGILLRGGKMDGKRFTTLGGNALTSPTAGCWSGKDLILTVGAKDRLQADWKRDVMAEGRSGEVWKIDTTSGTGTRLAQGMAWPNGISVAPEGFVISEAWRHRLVVLDSAGKLRPVWQNLPGYPSRIIPTAGGGYILAIFAPRNQLIEFVLREPEFLNAMTTQVDPRFWIAPSLNGTQSFKEPMQGAALRTMGIIKPWAPSWSYGLVVCLNDAFQPVSSYHSRADGIRHGVTSVCEFGGGVIAASRGSGTAVLLPCDTTEGAH